MSVVFNAGRPLAHEVTSPSEHGTSSAQLDVRRSLNGLTRQLLDLKASHEQTTDGAAKQNVLGSLLALAAQRQERLAAMIENYPGEVIGATVSAQVRASLPPRAQRYVEEEVTLEGEVEVLHADGPDGGRYIHSLRVAGSRLSMHFAGTPPPFQTDDRVRVRGVRVLKALAAQASGSITALAAAAVPNTFGPQRTAVFLLSFQDKPAVTSVSPADARDVVFDSPRSASNFFYEASYEQTWLTGDVFGPYVIPYPTGSCDITGIHGYAQLLAMAAGVDVASYAHQRKECLRHRVRRRRGRRVRTRQVGMWSGGGRWAQLRQGDVPRRRVDVHRRSEPKPACRLAAARPGANSAARAAVFLSAHRAGAARVEPVQAHTVAALGDLLEQPPRLLRRSGSPCCAGCR